MSYTPKRPEDLIPDNASHVEKDGLLIRKGSMAAVLTNAEIVESPHASAQEKQQALEIIRELAPGLETLNITKFMTWKNPEIQEIFLAAKQSNSLNKN